MIRESEPSAGQRSIEGSLSPKASLQAPTAPGEPMFKLQRLIGNQATGRWIQEKLATGRPDDLSGREAGRVADEVMRVSGPAPSASSPAADSRRQPGANASQDSPSDSVLAWTDLSVDLGSKLGFSLWGDEQHQGTAAAISVHLPKFSAEGTILMDEGVPEDTYELGFVQNLLGSIAIATYVDSDGKPFRNCLFTYPAPLLDSQKPKGSKNSKDPRPWMKNDSVVLVNAKNYIVNVADTPNWYFCWNSTDDPSEVKVDGNGKPGQLQSAAGRDSFVTWLAMREKNTGTMIYRHWVTWSVAWACAFNYANQTGSTTNLKGTVGSPGKGRGRYTPVLTGKVANDSLTTAWSDTE